MKHTNEYRFGQTADGREVQAYWIGDETGVSASISSLGAAITQLWVPDRNAVRADVVLGFDDVASYASNPFHLGVTVGRYANRIGQSTFTLDGQDYPLAGNIVGGLHHLHGGPRGLSRRLWDLVAHEQNSVTLRVHSKHNDQGYPGNVSVTVCFRIVDQRTLTIEYHTETDRPTVINLTNHSYFNLAGQRSTSVLDHSIEIAATTFTATDEDSIPTGVLKTLPAAMDFATPRPLGNMIDNPVLMATGGYDHNYVLSKGADVFGLAAKLRDPESGRTLTVKTTEPGMQLYTANYLRTDTSKTGVGYQPFQAVCLETQHFPDSPNQPGFPSTVVRPGRAMTSQTTYEFSAT